MKSCLLLIDIQESFRQRPYFDAAALPAYLAAQNQLIAACQAAGVPIVRVFHVDGPKTCLLYTSPSPRDKRQSRMPSSA